MKKALQFATYLLVVFSPTVTNGQETLIKDINTYPQQFQQDNDYAEIFCKCGNYLFFAASTEKGRELWRTDGTSDGTILLLDIAKGYASGYGGTMHCGGNGTLYFVANDGLNGSELWTSNGTTNGTAMVKDVSPGYNTIWTGVSSLGSIGDDFYFVTDYDYNRIPELWKTKGTATSTVRVSDIDLPKVPFVYSTVASSTHLFFMLQNPETLENEVWVTNGVSIGKLFGNNFWIGHPQVYGNKILFTHDAKLWSSDGTLSGTFVVKDFGIDNMESLHKFNDKVIFVVSGATWISDGTEAGTVPLTTGKTDASATVGNVFYGIGFDHSTGYSRIYKTNGGAPEVFNLDGDIGNSFMIGQIPVLDNKLVIQYFDEQLGQEIGIFETISQTSSLLNDINPGPSSSEPRAWVTLNNRSYFIANDGVNGSEIWSSDGTAGGTYLLKNIVKATGDAFTNAHNALINLNVSQGKLHFVANYEWVKTGLFSSDGTASGTSLKFEFGHRPATCIGRANDNLIYFTEFEFHKTNGGSNDVTLIRDLRGDVGGSGLNTRGNHSLQDKLLFVYTAIGGNISLGTELWVTDGTEAGTKVLKDINPGPASGASYDGRVLGSKLIFTGTDPSYGSEVWITDGTTDGTVLLKDINPGAVGSSPAMFTTFGNKVIFSASDNNYGNEVWITDGTEQGTVLLADLVSGNSGSEPKNFSASNSAVFFSAYDSERGWTLWKTDGTSAGTTFIKDVIPGKGKYVNLSNLRTAGNKLFFAADDGENGPELWVSDGTAIGTHVIDIVPGPNGSTPSIFTDINGVAYFQADGAFWRSNGTVQGTQKVSELEPLGIIAFENDVYFTAPHADYGIELFKVQFTKLDQQITVAPILDKTVGDAPFAVTSSVSSGLPLNVSNGDELSITNQTATILKPGTVSITFSQPGDALFNPAEATVTVCIFPAKPTISVTNSDDAQITLISSAEEGNQWYADHAILPDANEKTYIAEESGTYKVNAVVDGCVSKFSEEELVSITGIENDGNTITFYPNPGRDYLKIKTSGASSQEVAFFDVQGKPLNKIVVNGNSLTDYSIAPLKPGIYLIKIINGKTISYEKFVKE